MQIDYFGVNNNLICESDCLLYVLFVAAIIKLLQDCRFIYEDYEDSLGSMAMYANEFVMFLPEHHSNLSDMESMNIFTGKYSKVTSEAYFILVELLTRLWDRRVAYVTHDTNPIQHQEFINIIKKQSDLLTNEMKNLLNNKNHVD